MQEEAVLPADRQMVLGQLACDVEGNIDGKLAQLGGRPIGSVAKKMADQFFGKVANAERGELPAP